jgi:hypothetical protein
MVLAAQLERLIGLHQIARLGHALLAAEDETGEDQRLRAGAAVCQPALHQRDVGALLA